MAILGAGAIGCLFGAYLYGSGQSILLVHHRKEVVELIRRNGVVVRDPSGRKIKARIGIAQSLSQSDHPDLILITVKAYDTENAARHLGRLYMPGVPVLSIQNGFGNIETISRFVSRLSILGGTTTEAALLKAPGILRHTGRGITWIGEVDGQSTKRLKHVMKIFAAAGFRTVINRNIQGAIWSKGIVNSTINPISAIERVPNGGIIGSPHLMSIAYKIARECARVSGATRIRVSPEPGWLLRRTLKSSRRNKSSMLRDVESGRKTEIMQLNASIVKKGNSLGIETPYNALLTRLVLGMQHA